MFIHGFVSVVCQRSKQRTQSGPLMGLSVIFLFEEEQPAKEYMKTTCLI